MRLVYTHPNRLIVENMRNLLENSGIKVVLQNQYAGGGVGELAPIDAWPEVWLERDGDFDRANKIIDAASQSNAATWVCKACGEENAGSFEFCWSCSQERPQ